MTCTSYPCEGLPIFPQQSPNKVDLLFVLDDAPSMSVKLASLKAAVPAFVAALDARMPPLSYHLGVITADLGAGPQTLGALGCHPGGDGAKLHDTGGRGGVRYIDDNRIQNAQNVDDVTAALSALVDVPATGCELRQPLEAAYRALHDQLPENVGFLRSDALLAVVFVSDADDCSAPPNTDLFDPAATQYGTLDRFRCTQFGIACNGMPVPSTAVSGLTGCTSQTMADGGKLFDVDKYTNFFAKPAAQGGVKVDPRNVILVGITAPSDPVGVTITSPCAGDASVAMCPTLNRSCIAATDASYFGDPAVRLDAVVSSVRYANLASVCTRDDANALDAAVQSIASLTGVGCLPTPIAKRTDGSPDCVVTDVTANPDGSTSTRAIPSCAENGHVTPCWELVDVDSCAKVDVDRNGAAPTPGTTTQISCATFP